MRNSPFSVLLLSIGACSHSHYAEFVRSIPPNVCYNVTMGPWTPSRGADTSFIGPHTWLELTSVSDGTDKRVDIHPPRKRSDLLYNLGSWQEKGTDSIKVTISVSIDEGVTMTVVRSNADTLVGHADTYGVGMNRTYHAPVIFARRSCR